MLTLSWSHSISFSGWHKLLNMGAFLVHPQRLWLHRCEVHILLAQNNPSRRSWPCKWEISGGRHPKRTFRIISSFHNTTSYTSSSGSLTSRNLVYALWGYGELEQQWLLTILAVLGDTTRILIYLGGRFDDNDNSSVTGFHIQLDLSCQF